MAGTIGRVVSPLSHRAVPGDPASTLVRRRRSHQRDPRCGQPPVPVAGLENTTMSRLAAEVGLNQSSLYYFANRDAVVAALVAQATWCRLN